jgi:glycosyltransferase involved in cell wall biosynthesis
MVEVDLNAQLVKMWQPRKIIFWQNIPSILQAPFLRELSFHEAFEVVLATEEDMPLYRREMGWHDCDFGNTRCVDSRDPAIFNELTGFVEANCVHVFTGYHSHPVAWLAYGELREAPALLGAYSESFEPHGVKGMLRRIRSRWHTLQDRHRLDFILAVGELARTWFLKAGIEDSRIHSFGYFTENPVIVENTERGEVFNMISVGQLIHRKGLDLLLKALGNLKESPFQLTLVGCGVDEAKLQNLASELQIAEKVKFVGVVPNASIPEYLCQADLHVLPSRWDGWGAVINEALMSGVPTLASDACGGSCLLNTEVTGSTFRNGDIADLTNKLKGRMSLGKRKREDRSQLSDWANRISGRSAADYFLEILLHAHDSSDGRSAPVAPWVS